jgi:AcrR family transcriptional regulator
VATATREAGAGRRPKRAKQAARRTGRSPRAAGEPDFSARERLLNTAGRLMSDRHSIDVSLSEIAGHSGLNSALVKYYFGNKNGLLLALVEREAAAALQGFRELLRQDLPPAEKLRRHIAGIINNFFRTPYLNRLLHSLLDDRQSRSARQVQRIFVQPVMELQRELLTEGMRVGEFKQVDPLLFYVSVLGACDHLFNARYAVRSFGSFDDSIRERYIAHVCDVFIHGLRNLPPSPPGRRAAKRRSR